MNDRDDWRRIAILGGIWHYGSFAGLSHWKVRAKQEETLTESLIVRNEALQARVEWLEDVLRQFVAVTPVVPGIRGRWVCPVCHQAMTTVDGEWHGHSDDCPVSRARALLSE